MNGLHRYPRIALAALLCAMLSASAVVARAADPVCEFSEDASRPHESNVYDGSELAAQFDRLEEKPSRSCNRQSAKIVRQEIYALFDAARLRDWAHRAEGRYCIREGHYVVWRNYGQDLWILVGEWNDQEVVIETAAREMVEHLEEHLPAELLACMHERFAAEGSDEPDTSRYQQIEQFTVSLSPDDSAKGLAFGLSIGSTPDGTFQKIKAEEIENYLTALAEENRKRPRGEEQGQIEEQPARSPTDAVSSDTQSQSPESENASSSEDAEASDGSAQRKGDGEGILPPGAPPWLSRLAQMVLAYFGLDAYSHYFAMAMMMVAPDLMEQVAAFSASLTDGLASDDLDKAFEKLHEAFKLAMAVSSTVSGIQDALGEESMAEIVTEIAKEIQQMPPALRRDLGLELKGDFQKLVDVAAGVSDVDQGTFNSLLEGDLDTVQAFAAARLEQRVRELVVKEGVEFAKANGLPVSEGMISELVDGDTDNALPAIGRGVLDEFASRAGLSPSDVDAIADGRVADVLEAKAREEVHAAVTHFARKRGVDADAIALLETATSDEPGAALVELGVSKFPPEARSAVIALTSGDPYAAGQAVKQLATDELARELGPAAASALIGDGNFTGAAEAAVLERARRAGLDFVPEDATRIGDIDTEALTDDAIDEILRRSGLPIEARVLLPSLGAAAKGDAHARAALLRRAEDEILKEIGRQSAALESHVIDTITEAIAAMPVNVRDRVAELNERLAHTRDFRTAARLMAGEAFRDESERLAQTLEERERPELAGVVRSLANGDVARTLRLVVDGDFDPHVLTKLARSAAINELDRNISQSPAARAILGENIISRGGLGQQLVDGDIDGLGRLLHGRAQAQLGEARNRLVQDGLERIELARREIESHPDAPPALAGAVAVIETALRNGTPVSPGVLRERAERILAEVGLTDTEIDDALEGRPISAFARLAAAKAIRAVAGDDLLTATGAGQYAEKLTSLVRAEDPLAELAREAPPRLTTLADAIAAGDMNSARKAARDIAITRVLEALPEARRLDARRILETQPLSEHAIEMLVAQMGSSSLGRADASALTALRAALAAPPEERASVLVRHGLVAALDEARRAHPSLVPLIGKPARFATLVLAGEAPAVLAQRARQNAEAELGELRARASAELEQVVSLAGVSTREVLIRVAPPPLRRSVGALIDGDPPATVARDATHRFVARELGSVPADAVLTLLSGSQPASEAVVDAAFAMALQRTGKEALVPGGLTANALAAGRALRETGAAQVQRLVREAVVTVTPDTARFLALLHDGASVGELADAARRSLFGELAALIPDLSNVGGAPMDGTRLQEIALSGSDADRSRLFALLAADALLREPALATVLDPQDGVALAASLEGTGDVVALVDRLTERVAERTEQHLRQALWPVLRRTIEGAVAFRQLPRNVKETVLERLETHLRDPGATPADSIDDVVAVLEAAGLDAAEVAAIVEVRPAALRDLLLRLADAAGDSPMARTGARLASARTAVDALLLLVDPALRGLDPGLQALLVDVLHGRTCATGESCDRPLGEASRDAAVAALGEVVPNLDPDAARGLVEGPADARERVTDRILDDALCDDRPNCHWRHLEEAVLAAIKVHTDSDMDGATVDNLLQGRLAGPAREEATELLDKISARFAEAADSQQPELVPGQPLPIRDAITQRQQLAEAEPLPEDLKPDALAARLERRLARFDRFKSRSALARECVRLGFAPGQCALCPPDEGYGPGDRCPTGRQGEASAQ